MNEIFKLLGSIGIDTGDAKKKIDDVVDDAKKAGDKIEKSFGGISKESGKMAGKIALGLGTAALAIGSFSVKAAGDMSAMNSQFSQVFGKMESTAQTKVNGMAKEFNMVPNRIKPMFSKMTSMFMGLGMNTTQAMGEAEKATRLTADAAAFYDTSFEDANASLSSFIKGNYEGGESIGIFANDTQMAAYAIKKGVVSSTAEWQKLDEATKQATRLEYAQNMQKLGGVTGQAAREATGMENVMGNLKQSVIDLSAAFGAPILQPFLNTVNLVANGMSKLAGILERNPALVYVIIGAVTTLAAAFGAVYVAGNKAALIAALVSKSTTLFGAMANPVFLVIAAIGALVTAFIYFYNTSKPFKAFVDNLIPTLRDGLGKAIDYVSDAFSRFSSFITGTALPAISQFGNFLKGGIVSALAKMGTSIDGVKESLGGKFTSAISIVSGLLDKMGGHFGKIGAVAGVVVSVLSKVAFAALGLTGPWGMAAGVIVSFLTAWAKTGDLSTDGIQKVFDNLSSTISNVSGMITQYLPMIVTVGTNIITSLINGISAAIPVLTTTFITILNALINTLVTLLPIIITAGTQLLTALINGITAALPLIINVVMTIINSLVNALVLLLPLIINTGVQVLMALVNGIVQFLPVLISTFANLIPTIVTTLIALLPIIINAGIQILMALINGVISLLPTLINTALNLVMTLAGALISNLPKIIDAGIKVLNALIQGIIQILPQLIAAALKLIITLATALITNLPKIIDAGIKLLKALITGLIQVLPQLIAAALRLVVALAGALIENLPKILAAGVKLIGALIKGLIQMIGEVIGAAGKIGKAIGDKLKEFSLLDAGKNLVKGFAKGISSMVDSVVQSAKDLGKKAVDAVKGFLNIHSPSRVMMEIGAFTGEGFANGIANMQNQVQKASDELAKAALIDPTLNNGTLQQGFDVSSATPVPTSQTDTVDAKWSNLSDTLEQVLDYLARLLDKSTDVYLNGKRVGQLIEPDVSDNQLRNNILNERGVYNGGI